MGDYDLCGVETLSFYEKSISLWSDFSSFYSWFYKVTILKSMNATGERKMQMYF
jgi:hypothetical protein